MWERRAEDERPINCVETVAVCRFASFGIAFRSGGCEIYQNVIGLTVGRPVK
jgi:hypothetical protein